MTFMLINAVKELYKQNQELSTELEDLRTQIQHVNINETAGLKTEFQQL